MVQFAQQEDVPRAGQITIANSFDSTYNITYQSIPSPELRTILDLTLRRTADLGPDFAAYHKKLLDLKDRLEAGRFHLAVLGQFKRGKSMFLNALLGEPLLPTSVIPLTAIPTFITPGDIRGARVRYLDDRPGEEIASPRVEEITAFLARFVTEEQNPGRKVRLKVEA